MKMFDIMAVRLKGKTDSGKPKIQFVPRVIYDNPALLAEFKELSFEANPSSMSGFFWQSVEPNAGMAEAIDFCRQINSKKFTSIKQNLKEKIYQKHYADIFIVDIILESYHTQVEQTITKALDSGMISLDYIALVEERLGLNEPEETNLEDTLSYVEQLYEDNPRELINMGNNPMTTELEMQRAIFSGGYNQENNGLIDLLKHINKSSQATVFNLTFLFPLEDEVAHLQFVINLEEEFPEFMQFFIGCLGNYLESNSAVLTLRSPKEIYSFVYTEGSIQGISAETCFEAQTTNSQNGEKIEPEDIKYMDSMPVVAQFHTKNLLNKIKKPMK